MIKTLSAIACMTFFFITSASATQIAAGDFLGNEVVEDFESAGFDFPFEFTMAPYSLNGFTYSTTEDPELRLFQQSFCAGSYCIGANSETETIEIELPEEADRAGLSLKAGLAFEASVSFFSSLDVLLGTIVINSPNGVFNFAGWQTDSDLIKYIRVTESSVNDRVLVLDNISYEVDQTEVPEPLSAGLLGMGLLGFAGARKRVQRK